MTHVVTQENMCRLTAYKDHCTSHTIIVLHRYAIVYVATLKCVLFITGIARSDMPSLMIANSKETMCVMSVHSKSRFGVNLK